MSTPQGPFVLVQNTPNNPPGTSLLPLADVAGGLEGVQSVTLGVGNNNNVAIDSGTLIVLITPNAGGSVLTGLTGGSPGRVLYVQTVVALTFTVADEDANSTAANRIRCPTNGNSESFGALFQGFMVVYDGTGLRWRLIGKPDAA